MTLHNVYDWLFYSVRCSSLVVHASVGLDTKVWRCIEGSELQLLTTKTSTIWCTCVILTSCGCYDYGVVRSQCDVGGMASVCCTQTDKWFYHHLSQVASGCVECCGSTASCTQAPTCKLHSVQSYKINVHPENRSQLASSGTLFLEACALLHVPGCLNSNWEHN